MLTFAEENYLKAIFHLEHAMQRLSADHASPVATGLLAESMGVQGSTVTDMVRKLADKHYVTYEKSRGVNLTTEGYQIALQVIRRHRLWETFLVHTLGFDWSQVHELAEQLEHVQSQELIARLEKHLNYPTVDPHGDPIPDAEGHMKPLRTVSLADARVGTDYVMAGITDHSPALLHYLDKLGMQMGAPICIRHREAFDNSLTVGINGLPDVVISAQTGAAVLVLNA